MSFHKKKFTFDDPEDSYWNESDSNHSSIFDDHQSRQLQARAALDNLFGHDDATTPVIKETKAALQTLNLPTNDIPLSSASPRIAGKLVDEFLNNRLADIKMTPEKTTESAPSVVSEASASSLPSEAQRLDLDYSRLKAEHRKLQQHLETVRHERFRPVDVNKAVDRLLRGQDVPLEFYRSMDDKLGLLKAAVACHEPNVIIKVVMFLKTTLKEKLFYDILREDAEARAVFIDYLQSSDKGNELCTFLSAMGKFEQAAMAEYSAATRCKQTGRQLQMLRNCLTGSFSIPELKQEANYISDQVMLLETQLAIEKMDSGSKSELFAKYPKNCSVVGTPVLATLYYCCLYHYDDPLTCIANPVNFRERMRVDEKQHIWVAVSALTRQSRWPDIERLLQPRSSVIGNLPARGLLSSLNSKWNCPFSWESLLKLISSNRTVPPKDFLCRLLRGVGDHTERLNLAKEYGVPEIIIECLVAEKDRAALSTYAMKLPPNSPESFKAIAALNNTSIKWKS